MKRAQAAMEFLMTYGWAILVVLVAIGALAYFGILSPARFLPESCTLAPGIGCNDFKITYGAPDVGTIQLLLMNGMGETVTNANVTIIGCATQDTDADGNDPWVDGNMLGGTTPGDEGILLQNCDSDTLITGPNTRVKTDITVTWTSSSGIQKTRVGSLTGKST